MPSKFALKQKLLNKVNPIMTKEVIEDKKNNITKNNVKIDNDEDNPILKLPIKPLKYKL